MSTDHPWVRMIEKHKKETLEFLLRLAVDVHNDCRAETLSSRSWPSRSLSFVHSNNLMRVFQSEGWDADFVFHYRDPVTYAEMRNIVVKFEMEKVAAELKKCICYSLQMDGSSDRQQIDSKFITAGYVPIYEVCVKTVFLGVASSDRGAAAGLLDSLISCLESVNVDTEKLVGVTTDGESANTGKKGGLWKFLKDHVGRNILTAWCVCHRSDLALESLQAEVPELPIWLSNLLALVNFFRTSPRRTKLLHQEDECCLTFPKHFEVRFAQHTLNLIRAVLHNLKAATKVCEKMVSGEIASDKKECAMARGFMQKLNATSQQLWLTTLMYDLCKIFERLQKIYQKSYLILPDVITARDSSVENLKIMDQMPIPGGKEEDHLSKLQEDSTNNEAGEKREIILSLR